MADQNGGDVVEVTGPGGTSFRARGYDLISILILVMITTMTVGLYVHMDDTRRSNVENVNTQREVARSVRLSACILATSEDKREREYMQPNSYCNRMAQ